jgi:hypothetical protein
LARAGAAGAISLVPPADSLDALRRDPSLNFWRAPPSVSVFDLTSAN